MSSALVLGSTGAVGILVVKELLSCGLFEKVTAITRREFEYDGPKKELLVKKIIDFEKIEEYKDAFKGHSHGFCCLGSTRKQAGSAENFYKFDHDYIVKSAEIFKNENADSVKPLHFLIVSAYNANINSVFLYSKTKGQIEKDLIEMKFPRLSIFQPGMLLNRGHDKRILETITNSVFVPAINIIRPKKDSVPVEKVAKSMMKVSQLPPKEKPNESNCVVEYISNYDIHNIADNTEIPGLKNEKEEKK